MDYLLRNLPGLQALNGLVVERDAIFSEDEDCVNTDRPLSNMNANEGKIYEPLSIKAGENASEIL